MICYLPPSGNIPESSHRTGLKTSAAVLDFFSGTEPGPAKLIGRGQHASTAPVISALPHSYRYIRIVNVDTFT